MTARKFTIEVIVDPKKDNARALNTIVQKMRNLRMSEDAGIAATGAKWEAAAHEALQAVLGRNGKKT
jgi:hypothetical protein